MRCTGLPPVCAGPCLDRRAPLKPVTALAAAAGFTVGTIIAGDIYTAGNLRAGSPRACVCWALGLPYNPPAGKDRGQCLIVWRPATADAAVSPGALRLGDLGNPG